MSFIIHILNNSFKAHTQFDIKLEQVALTGHSISFYKSHMCERTFPIATMTLSKKKLMECTYYKSGKK